MARILEAGTQEAESRTQIAVGHLRNEIYRVVVEHAKKNQGMNFDHIDVARLMIFIAVQQMDSHGGKCDTIQAAMRCLEYLDDELASRGISEASQY